MHLKINKLFSILFFFSALYAESKTVAYRVEFGIVGEVAKIQSQYTKTKNTYTIDTKVKVIGMLAKMATNNLREQHISKGTIDKSGLHITNDFTMLKHYGNYRSITHYHVDHQKKKIIKTYKKWRVYDNKKERKVSEYSYILGYYAKDDLITLFLNLNKHIPNKMLARKYIFKAIGEDRKQGRVDIDIPKAKEKKEMIKLLGKPKKNEWLANVIMHRKLYNSKKGELMVRMNGESLIEKAVLKDIFMYGDVRIIRE